MLSVTAPCVGRKLRRRSKVFIQGFPLDTKLYSTTGEEEPMTEEEKASEKLFFTIFRTLSSTATITILSTNRSVTVSVLLLCTESGAITNHDVSPVIDRYSTGSNPPQAITNHVTSQR
ncbi:hypothetical protein Pmani_008770 [Petrolisthes manimaculis]|uniref:Uncharacterized protein n=1 Tax=Petrolisthes manimaculis TaxID=1843537 RepID=A0AAE1Q4Z8_9EUCA|nr:hypothetical protein Pmani_008770 [Petrolisthes manimaculis]